MLGLLDFLIAAGVEVHPQSLKIHLACWNGKEHPIEVYYAARFKAWQEEQRNRNFKCEHALSLIDLGNSHWLFVGLYDVLYCQPDPKDNTRFLYSTKLLAKQSDLIARIVVQHKRSRTSCILYLRRRAGTFAQPGNRSWRLPDEWRTTTKQHDLGGG